MTRRTLLLLVALVMMSSVAYATQNPFLGKTWGGQLGRGTHTVDVTMVVSADGKQVTLTRIIMKDGVRTRRPPKVFAAKPTAKEISFEIEDGTVYTLANTIFGDPQLTTQKGNGQQWTASLSATAPPSG